MTRSTDTVSRCGPAAVPWRPALAALSCAIGSNEARDGTHGSTPLAFAAAGRLRRSTAPCRARGRQCPEQQLRRLLERGLLAAGARLPSIRQLAKTLAVSPNTVVVAYDRLVAEGEVESRGTAGYFASAPGHGPAEVAALIEAGEEQDPIWLAQQSNDQPPGLLLASSSALPARRADGIDLGQLESLLVEFRPRLLFVQNILHNPTGWTAPAANLHRVLTLAERHGVLIAEDDVYGHLLPGSGTRLAQLASLAGVAYYSSFCRCSARPCAWATSLPSRRC